VASYKKDQEKKSLSQKADQKTERSVGQKPLGGGEKWTPQGKREEKWTNEKNEPKYTKKKVKKKCGLIFRVATTKREARNEKKPMSRKETPRGMLDTPKNKEPRGNRNHLLQVYTNSRNSL